MHAPDDHAPHPPPAGGRAQHGGRRTIHWRYRRLDRDVAAADHQSSAQLHRRLLSRMSSPGLQAYAEHQRSPLDNGRTNSEYTLWPSSSESRAWLPRVRASKPNTGLSTASFPRAPTLPAATALACPFAGPSIPTAAVSSDVNTATRGTLTSSWNSARVRNLNRRSSRNNLI